MSVNCMFNQCTGNNEGGGAMRLAKVAFQSLSPEEQHSVTQDLYGSAAIEVAETPEFLEGKLDELEKELGLLSEDTKRYYTRAIAMEQMQLQQDGCKAYFGSKNFRFQFLRAERFDACLAAKRLAEYFHHKFELFGEEKLASTIRQADLNNEEKEALVSGAMTHTGVTDFAGRPVLIIRRSYFLYFSLACIKRVCFYILQHIVQENEAAQKKGVVLIGYHMHMPFVNPSRVRVYHPAIRMVKHGLPVRCSAIHFLYSDFREHFILNFILVLFPRAERARVLTHYKRSHQECMQDMMTFGINPDELALTGEGDFQYETICDYWKCQRQLEDSSQQGGVGECYL